MRPPDEREAPLPGGAPRKKIANGKCDKPELRPQAPRNQAALRRRADFARAAVFHEFGYQAGRAIDYNGFEDRLPNQLPPQWPRATAWWAP